MSLRIVEEDKKKKKFDFVICCPGHPSSGLQSWNIHRVLENLLDMGYTYYIPPFRYMSNIYVARNRTIGFQGYRKDQKPFRGAIEYKKMIWFDSDQIFSTDQLLKLLKHDVDIVAAWSRCYSTGDIDQTNWASCGEWPLDGSFGDSKGYKMEEVPKLPRNEKGLVEVGWTGFPLVVIKYGVFESMPFPWFEGPVMEWKDKDGVEMADIAPEDAYFCVKARRNGFSVYVDPESMITHEKLVCI